MGVALELRLALSHNVLTALPTSFVVLTRLRYINLKGNDLREIPPVVSLGQVSVVLLPTFQRLINLPPLRVSQLCSLQSLEILDISRNKIKRMPDRPGRLASLRVSPSDRLDRESSR